MTRQVACLGALDWGVLQTMDLTLIACRLFLGATVFCSFLWTISAFARVRRVRKIKTSRAQELWYSSIVVANLFAQNMAIFQDIVYEVINVTTIFI